SVMYRMLQLKASHPLPTGDILPDSFDFSLDRDQQCAKIEAFDQFENNYPLAGMPYGLPGIEKEKQAVLERWLETGAKARYPGISPTVNQIEIDQWEAFFNGESLKQQLMSRYIYEHLFLANIYFDDSNGDANNRKIGEQREFFKLVRSKTPSGHAIQIIPSRRPFDEPGQEFFYRLQRVSTTILAKQHMPYQFGPQRMKRWQSLFLEPDYKVTELPSYKPSVASNPFITFKELPVRARYEFMLDEAQFSIMGFIKGPVCRGQVALNVINDHFWVLFVNPEAEEKYATAEFLVREAKDLRLPAEKQSNVLMPVTTWMQYSRLEKKYVKAKQQQFDKIFDENNLLDLSILWDGNGSNRNAALTIYRHFDSSSVIKGLYGDTPKTAWVIGYPLLERIHYLLVAGFDVYGNVGHQLLTRLYMDFLRMEGEYNFLRLLPKDVAQQELDFWYRGEEARVEGYLKELHDRESETSAIVYKTDNPKKEVFNLIRKQFGEQVIAIDRINTRPVLPVSAAYQTPLQQLSAITGVSLSHLPEQSIVRLSLNNGQMKLLTLVRNRAHSSVSHLFGEERRIMHEEQTLSVVEGIVGTYPNAFYDLQEVELSGFVSAVANLSSEQDYKDLQSRYGVRRTDKNFWAFSDSIYDIYLHSSPVSAGLLDYNRIENR
ncbi:MAG TPA: peptidylprolyl isomerase, partial [Porticoccus sp.]|nr:peptidylprolyl isomerase [Porticoccus sp.]